jgi:cell division transport system ATP-binding protein
VIILENVCKTYKNGVNALYDVNLVINPGEFVYIVGPTGCGKSTLIKLLNGEEIPTKGRVLVNEVDVGKLKHKQVPKYRRNIGVVFQDFRLLEHKTVYENIAFAMECIGASKEQMRVRIREVLDLVGLLDKARSFPNELSGGQQQRVAIARALVNSPSILIADEPTGNLDPKKSNEIVELLNKINQDQQTTILMVTHDVAMVDNYRHRTVRLDSGYLQADINEGGYHYHENTDQAY